jgi:predicted metal-binding membrane protein
MERGIRPWTAQDFFYNFIMWALMMAGMMTPTVTPMILVYARLGRWGEDQQKPLGATVCFAAGYLLAWTIFALVATGLQYGLARAGLLTPALASANDFTSGAILIVAGLYQWSSLKIFCLTNCRMPLLFIQQHGGFKKDTLPSLSLGLRQGGYCVGCCGALMPLLFVGSVTNIVWIAGLAVLLFLEKAMSDGRNVSRLIGMTLIIGGISLICQKLNLLA